MTHPARHGEPGPQAIPLEQVEDIGSTSEALKLRAALGERQVALMARRQTAGRARQGRNWATVDGNLHLSVLLRPEGAIVPGHWSLLAAVALAETILRFTVPERIRLKWPNDVLLDGKKAAGILLDAQGPPVPWLVIGFGVNLAGAPAGLDRPVASLASLAPPPAPQFARLLLDALAAWQTRYLAVGFAPVAANWQAVGHKDGERIRVRQGDLWLDGVFRALGPEGSLRMDGPSGPATVTWGEIGEAPS